MNGYRVDWVGALSAGVAAATVFLLVKRAKLTGAPFYVVLGLAVAGLSLALQAAREALRLALSTPRIGAMLKEIDKELGGP